MTQPSQSGPPIGTSRWADAVQALSLLAIDPVGLGGASLRSPSGPVRDTWLSALRERLPADTPVRRMPANIGEQRLLGGLDLSATLAAGKPIIERGLLAQSDGGVIVLAMAERVTAGTTSHLAACLDTGVVTLERDGLTATLPARLAVVALDEGEADDERAPAKLLDRLAFLIELGGLAPRDTTDPLLDAEAIAKARSRLAAIDIGSEIIEAIVATGMALGVPSLRTALLTVKAARAAAALAGHSSVEEEDATLAASLVLAPRATQLPQPTADEELPPQPPQPEPPNPDEPEDPPQDQPPPEQNAAEEEAENGQPPPPPPNPDELKEMMLEAVTAAIPAGLLAQLQRTGETLNRMRTQGRAGAERKASRGGRPAGTRRGDPRHGGRLNVLETLRAAAPWQTLRRREVAARPGTPNSSAAAPTSKRIEVRRADFRINRTKQKSETATIFVVDASGSSALNRLAEAKGAVELLLADCYVRRDQVAVLAFRGAKSEVLLPPTRSLVRAKRSLAGLPGGGATPLAAAIDQAAHLADAVRRKGQTPTLIVLTDGRANVARDGTKDRNAALSDALSAARALRILGITTLLIDTSPKPQPQAEQLAAEMAALYLPLPYANAAKLSKAVRAITPQK